MQNQSPGNRSRGLRLIPVIAAIALIALIATPGAAIAQEGVGPTEDQYAPQTERIGDQVAAGGAPGGPAAPSGDADTSDRVISGLPFTGLDIGLLLGVSMLLGASGLALRRFAGGGAGR